MSNIKILHVEVKYKQGKVTNDIDLAEEYPEVTEYTEEFLSKAVEMERIEVLSEIFVFDFAVDLSEDKVTFSLGFKPNVYLNDVETKKLSEVINMEDYKGLSDEEILEESYDELVTKLNAWVESKIDVTFKTK